MKTMTLGQRIGSVACLVILTVATALFYFIAKGFSKDIAFAVLEQKGNRYQRPLEGVLESFGQHELLARQVLAGHSELQSDLKQAENRADQSMEEFHTANSQLGVDLHLTPVGLGSRKLEHYTWENLNNEWESLKASQLSQRVESSDKLHEHLLADVRIMISHAGDMSNLILDTDLDSYYLADVTLGALPQTQYRLATIEKLGQDVFGNGTLTADQRIDLAVAAGLLSEADLGRITGDVRTSLTEDSNFHGTSKTLQENLRPAADTYIKANQELVDLMQKIVASPDTQVRTADFVAAANNARSASFNLWQTGSHELDTLLQIRIDDLNHTRLWALAWTSVALAVTFGMAFVILRKSIRELVVIASALLDGAAQFSAAALEISTSSQSLARSASVQAGSNQETSASSEQINASAKKNADSSRSMAALVASSHELFALTKEQLQETVVSMDEITQSSHLISKIIRVIDEIAFQSNILALNASVEAARAGHSGRGFAVVADEVRSLSQRSANAAKETAILIEDCISKSRHGKDKVDQVATAILDITEGFVRVKVLVDEVTSGSEEQFRGSDQITRALIQMDQITQSNAASSEQSAAAAEELSAQSKALKDLVTRLNVIVGG